MAERSFQLAQINVARMLAPLGDQVMAGFVNAIEGINALADASPGFVWRLQGEEGNATALRVFDDDTILVNLSVWESVEALKAYVYGSRHREYVRRRKVWFEHFGRPYYALWWVPRGNIPRVAEAIRRLETMQREGDSTEAFSFGRPFPPPSPEGGAADALRGAPSAGLGMLPFGYPRGVPDPPPHPHPRRTHMARYALSTTVPGTFDDVKERVVGALKEQGFGILTEIDMQATLKKKLDVDMERYEILGACNPPLAHRAVGADRNIGLLLPCNVILREAGEGRIEVGMLDPVSMFSLVDEDVADSMQDLPAEARRRLQAALEAVGSSTPA